MTPNDSQAWTVSAFLTSAGTALAGLSLSEWLAIMGFIGMLLSLLIAWLKYRNDLKLFRLDIAIKQKQLQQMQATALEPCNATE